MGHGADHNFSGCPSVLDRDVMLKADAQRRSDIGEPITVAGQLGPGAPSHLRTIEPSARNQGGGAPLRRAIYGDTFERSVTDNDPSREKRLELWKQCREASCAGDYFCRNSVNRDVPRVK
jgi:hypothetical protein